MSKVRVDELAAELGLSPDDLFAQLKGMGFDVVNVTSNVDRSLIDMVSDMLLGQPAERDSSARRIVSVRKGAKEPEVEVRMEEEIDEDEETEAALEDEQVSQEAEETAPAAESDQEAIVGVQTEEATSELEDALEPEEEPQEPEEPEEVEKPRRKIHLTALRIEKEIGGEGEEIPSVKIVEKAVEVEEALKDAPVSPDVVEPVAEKEARTEAEPEAEQKRPRKVAPKRERKPSVQDLLDEVDELDSDEEDIPEVSQEEPTLKVVEIKHSAAPQPTWRREIPRKKIRKAKKKETEVQEIPTPSTKSIKITKGLTVGDLAGVTGTKASEIIQILLQLGVMATINQTVDPETASLVVSELGFDVQVKTGTVEDLLKDEPEIEANLRPRPPVITVMGHVDHGKTSLLDAVRETDVASGEAGGITQHIGAHLVNHTKGQMVFLDTPGHEAFTAMRARGAQITDIVVLVVAADDGVKPQTIEAIDHAKAADVPIVVAINKIDKPEADPDRVKRELADHGVVPEDWGGDVLSMNVSAKQGTGIDDLLDLILLQAEILELVADPTRDARGIVIESKLERGRGPVVTVLVKSGTLQTGSYMLAGTHLGRVRVMNDDYGKKIEKAGPSVPAEIIGLQGVPAAGESFAVFTNEVKAKRIAQLRMEEVRAGKTQRQTVTLEDLFTKIQEGEVKDLNIVLKADVHGSIGAIKDVLDKISMEEVRVNVIHEGTGGINEGDVILAAASSAVVIGFNVRPDKKALDVIRKENVDVRFFNVIYDLERDIRNALKGMLAPVYHEEMLGRAEVRDTFFVPKVGTIAGCHIDDGVVRRNSEVRIIRDGVVIFESKIGSLRRFKDDVREVGVGFECGIGIEDFNDIKVGDIIENFEMVLQEVELE